jgi:hypothetical protein
MPRCFYREVRFQRSAALLHLSYLGGTRYDIPYSIVVDASGAIYIGGQTNSTDFPLAGTPWRPILSSEGTFLAKLSGDGEVLIWSTVLNGRLIQLSVAPDGSVYYLSQEGMTDTLTKLDGNGQLQTMVNVTSNAVILAVGADGSVYIGGYGRQQRHRDPRRVADHLSGYPGRLRGQDEF